MRLIELLDIIEKDPAGCVDTHISFFQFGGKPDSNHKISITTNDDDFFHLYKIVKNNPFLANKTVCWIKLESDLKGAEIALTINYGDPFYEKEKAKEEEILKNASIY